MGIISEYNPFHNGHAYHIRETRRLGATHIIAVMSGDFVQRGEPALLSKWARAEMALCSGANLVVELPLPWSMATAERFAFGAVSLLCDMGCVNHLSFGSECGDVAKLDAAAQAVDSPLLSSNLHTLLDQGATYAKARELAVQSIFGEDTAQLLRTPNNILGIEYLRAMHRLHASFSAVTMRRIGAKHDGAGALDGFASASHIREQYRLYGLSDVDSCIPENTKRILAREQSMGRCPSDLRMLERAILSRLRMMTAQQISRLPDITEGLEHRVVNAVRKSATLEEVIKNIKTKRYTHARIRRIILSAYLGIESDRIPQNPPYIRILGFDEKGVELMKQMKHTANLPLVVRTREGQRLIGAAQEVWKLESVASDQFGLATPIIQSCGANLNTEVVRIKKEAKLFNAENLEQ